MSSASDGQMAPPSPNLASNFKSMLDAALAKYKKKTGNDLLALWLASELQTCDSVDSVLDILRHQAKAFERSDDQKLIKWIDPLINVLFTFSDALGDGISLAFPPAKVIFTGISALLGAAKDVRASHGAIIDLFERIQSFFKRLEVYTQVSLTTQMSEVLVKIVIELLSILSIATKEVKRPLAKLFGRKLLGRTDIEDALKRLDSLIQEEVQMAIAQILKATTEVKEVADKANVAVQQVLDDVQEVKCDVVEVKRNVGEVKSDVEEVKWAQIEQDILKWFSPPDPSMNYNIARETQSEGTAAWFLEGKKFENWLLSGSLLWIHGKPGSGKSILCSATINHVMSLRDAGEASLAYFYFDFRDEEKKQDFTNFVKSLLVQLSAYSIPCCKIIFRLYSRHAKGTQQPSNGILEACLREMLSAVAEKPIYIIVDALDECPDLSGMPTPREAVLNLLKSLVRVDIPTLRIFVTSRPEFDIQAVLEPLADISVSLHDEYGQQKDIFNYVRNVVHTDKKMRRWRSDQKDLVVEELSEKADGMFRWVFCQLDLLRQCLPASIRQTLNQLPPSLDDTYLRTLKQIPQANQVLAHRMLQCLVVAVRPLYVEELAELLAFEYNATTRGIPQYRPALRLDDQTEAVLSTCSSLVTIIDEPQNPISPRRQRHGEPPRQIVQFSHFSVKEFLVSTRFASSPGDISQYHIRLASAHTVLTQACLGLLLHSDDHVTDESTECFPLAEYAAGHWVEHAQFEDVASRVRDGIETLFDPDKPHFSAWVNIYDIDSGSRFKHSSEIKNPLYYAVLCELDDLIEHLAIKHPHYINALCGEFQFPLLAAFIYGNMKAAEFLLEHGVDIDARDENAKTILLSLFDWFDNDDTSGTVLGMVDLLLKYGADVNARDNSLTSSLHLAINDGQLKIAQLLLKHEADVNAQDNDGQTPLHKLLTGRTWRQYKEEEASNHLQLFLEHGADVNKRDKHNITPLCLAIRLKRFKLGVILLEHGADAIAEIDGGMTPLHILSECWIKTRVANVNDRDKDNHYTPLDLAIVRRDLLKFAGTLLEYAADASAENDHGMTSLHILADYQVDDEGDALNLARLLLEHGAEVNRRDGDDETPLRRAMRWDQFNLAGILVENGADPNTIENEGLTLLHRLSEEDISEKYDVLHHARLFLKHGADVNRKDGDSDTPLHLAILWDQFELAKLLLEHGADANAENDDGSTPMHMLSEPEENKDDILNLAHSLLKHGARVNGQDKDKDTPLHIAIRCNRCNFARILIEHGADTNAENNDGMTPLHVLPGSKIKNEDDVLNLAYSLLEHGADVNRRDKRNRTPLYLAMQWNQFKLAGILVEHGADPTTKNDIGMTLLHRLSEKEISSKCDVLHQALIFLKHSADVNSQNTEYETPLHLALRRDNFKLAELFLKHGADASAEGDIGFTPMHILSEADIETKGDILDLAHLLLEHGAEVDTPDWGNQTPLHIAIQSGNYKLAGILLEHGANPNAVNNDGKTALRMLSEGINYDDSEGDFVNHARLVLKHATRMERRDEDNRSSSILGKDATLENKTGETSAGQHVSYNTWERGIGHGVAQQLPECSSDLNLILNAQDESQTIYLQSSLGPFQIATFLLYHGADPDLDPDVGNNGHELVDDTKVRNKNHLTLLHLASFKGWVEMVRVLLDRSENPNSEDDLCRTPLHLVAKGGSDNNGVPSTCVIEVTRLLLEHGADINAQDKDKTTPLHLASYYGNVAIIPVLIDNGANVSAKTAQGQTPLHIVLSRGVCFSESDGAHVVKLLLRHGAKANVQDSNGATPSDLASKTGCQWLTTSTSRQFQSKSHRRPRWLPYSGFPQQREASGWHVADEADKKVD